MAKKVRVQWMDAGTTYTETCMLISENDRVYTNNDESREVHGILETLSENGYVIFEDDNGLFVLIPNQIIYITMLEPS